MSLNECRDPSARRRGARHDVLHLLERRGAVHRGGAVGEVARPVGLRTREPYTNRAGPRARGARVPLETLGQTGVANPLEVVYRVSAGLLLVS